MITATEKAGQKFKEKLIKKKYSENMMMRVNYGGIGGGGPNIYLTLDELNHDNDIVVETNGIRLVYDSKLESLLDNSVIDYSDKWFNRRFFIKGGSLSSC